MTQGRGRRRSSSAPTASPPTATPPTRSAPTRVAVLARHHGIPFYVAAPSTHLRPPRSDGDSHPDRGARRGARSRSVAGARPLPRRWRVQPGLRRHARRADQRHHHRARRVPPALPLQPDPLPSGRRTAERAEAEAGSAKRGRGRLRQPRHPSARQYHDRTAHSPDRCGRAATCSTSKPSPLPSGLPHARADPLPPISPRSPSTRHRPRARRPSAGPPRRSISSASPRCFFSSPRASVAVRRPTRRRPGRLHAPPRPGRAPPGPRSTCRRRVEGLEPGVYRSAPRISA